MSFVPASRGCGPELAGKPGWANTTGETTSRRQAMARLIERWEELRRVSRLADLNLDCDRRNPAARLATSSSPDWGGHPGSSERWVDLKDDLSVSLFQARLVERDLPIKLVIDGAGVYEPAG